MKRRILYVLAVALIAVIGCQKELSLENGNSPAAGSLQDDALGDCLPKTVNGTYTVAVPLVPTANTISVDVNVTRTGTYTITTDTVNGCYFRGVGIFTTTGINTVTLRGNGTPFATGTFNYIVSFDGTFCDVQVDVTSPGVGTLAGSPNACAPITVNGGYSPGVALTAANNAVVQVNVTTAGAFNFTTDTVDGIWFNFSGPLALGAQTPTLVAHGAIPAGLLPGDRTFTVKLGAGSCTFVVPFVGPASGTVNCGSTTFTGTYTGGVAMTAANTATIGITITTPGAYNITTNTVNGVTFSASGVFANTTPTTLVLTASGTPQNTAITTSTFTVTWGASTCTFNCTFGAPLSDDYFPRTTNSNWSYEIDDVADDSLYRFAIAPTLAANSNTYNIFMEDDDGVGLPDSSGYYRRDNAQYFERVNFEDYNNGTPLWIEYLMLDTAVATGGNWTTPAGGVTVDPGSGPTKVRFKMTSTKFPTQSLTTSGSPTPVVYNNVIEVDQQIEAEILPGVWQNISAALGSAKVYYAKGIGIIKIVVTSPFGSFTQELRRYQVF